MWVWKSEPNKVRRRDVFEPTGRDRFDKRIAANIEGRCTNAVVWIMWWAHRWKVMDTGFAVPGRILGRVAA